MVAERTLKQRVQFARGVLRETSASERQIDATCLSSCSSAVPDLETRMFGSDSDASRFLATDVSHVPQSFYDDLGKHVCGASRLGEEALR